MTAAPPFSSLADIRQALAAGELTCRRVVEHYLANIKTHAHLNAFAEVYEAEALAAADGVDERRAAGTAGRLAGLVVGIKDVLCHQDHPLQASSRILEGFVSQFTGTAVQRLLNEDAIVIGRQSCDEFAMGSSNETAVYGPVRNAADPERVPGGSSGGSAVAVQADMCLVSLGTDTGGSVRQPAAFCGVVGLKPTYSRISRYGLAAYASSFDSIGILSRTVADAALVLEVIAGADEYDSTVSHRPVPAYAQALSLREPARVGYYADALENPAVSEDIRRATQKFVDDLRKKDHEVTPVNFSFLDYVLPTYYILTTAEASSNLSRYDGVRYGFRADGVDSLESLYKKTRTNGFGQEVKRRIMLGTFVTSANYFDAYFTKAQKMRRLIKEETDALLTEYDFLVLPTTPTTAFKLGEKTTDPLAMYLADLYTVQASVAGVPVISVPYGEDRHKLPIGMQIMAGAFKEDQLLAFASDITEEKNENAVS